MTSSLPGEVSLLKVVYFLFGSQVSASAVSKPIFKINATKDKTKIYTPLCFLGEAETFYPLVLWLQSPHQKSVVVGSLIIPAQADQEVLSLDRQQGGVNLRHCPKSRQIMLVVSNW